MTWRGKFHIELPHLILPNRKRHIILPNTVVDYGANLFLTSFFQNLGAVPAPFYVGLTSAAYSYTSVLADMVTGEPVGGGYARQSVARSGAGWTVALTNNQRSAKSANLTFTASGNWTGNWIRAFLCDVVSGAGNLLAVSAALPAAITTFTGQAPIIAYEADLRG